MPAPGTDIPAPATLRHGSGGVPSPDDADGAPWGSGQSAVPGHSVPAGEPGSGCTATSMGGTPWLPGCSHGRHFERSVPSAERAQSQQQLGYGQCPDLPDGHVGVISSGARNPPGSMDCLPHACRQYHRKNPSGPGGSLPSGREDCQCVSGFFRGRFAREGACSFSTSPQPTGYVECPGLLDAHMGVLRVRGGATGPDEPWMTAEIPRYPGDLSRAVERTASVAPDSFLPCGHADSAVSACCPGSGRRNRARPRPA